MALVLQDRVSVTSAGSGTGDLVLGSAYPGYRTFASCIPTGSIVYYTIANQALGYETEWEVGYGTYVLATDTLQRNTGNPATSGVYSSSNSNAYVNFTAGTNGLQIFITQPSEQAVFQQPDGVTEFNEGPISVVGANATAGTFSSTLGQFTSNEPNYSQLYIQNQSGDANASTDIAAYNELGDGTNFFVDMGIAGSNYNAGAYPIFQQNDGYLYSYGNATTTSRLVIGTQSPDANVVVFAGGVETNNTALTISGTNQNATFANGVTVTETLNANSITVTTLAYAAGNIANAANGTVLVTQAYVDNAVAAGIDIHDPVDLATVTVLSGSPAYNQPGGTGNGVNATLTATGVGTLSVDGQNADAGFRILVQSQANAVQNGVYTVTTEGTLLTPYVLTRATDSDNSTTLTQGSYYFVNAGDTLAYYAFVVNTVGAINFGVTDITFAEFSRVPTYIGTSPINVSGQTISLTTVPVSKGGTNLTTFVAGDVVYANTANTLASLPIGSQYNSLVVSAGALPSWGTIALGSSNAVSGTLGATNGGTGQSTYTTGDTLYSNGTNTLAKLPGQITTTQKFLSQTGDGANSAAPVWDTISSGSITGLGTMSTQNANSVTITGGSLNNVTIGGSTPNTGAFTNVNATTVTATTGSFTNVSGNGAALTNINASNISSGTIDNARTTGNTSNSASTLVLRDTNGSFGANVISASFNGDGSAISSINASNLSSGTVANARTTAASANGASTIVARDSGGNFSANTITANVSGSGAGLTNINASNISSGTIGNAYTTANASNGAATIVLRGASGEFAAGAITASSFSGNGSALTAINASSITTGTIDNARTTAASANGASTIVARDANGSFSGNVITGTTGTFTNISGNASALTAINASNITSGTINNAYTTASSSNGANTIALRDANGSFSANIITANGSALTAINASSITTGTIDNARTTASSSNGANTIALRDANGSFSANIITANGSALTAINASNISSGTVGTARLGSGTANATTYLAGDSTWKVITAPTVNDGTLTLAVAGTGLSGSQTFTANQASNATFTVTSNANSSNGASTVVARDSNGSFSANVGTFNSISGNGVALTGINASNITSGTIGNVYTTANSANGASTIVARDSNGGFSANAGTFTTVSGNGVALTAINASNIASGTIGNTYTTANSANGASTIVARDTNGSFIANVVTGTTGTFTNISGNGVALTAINASNITSGTLDNARTTAASANGASTIVARDANGSFAGNVVTGTTGTFTNISGNGVALTAINASNITSGTISNAYTTANSSNGASTIVLRDSNGSFAGNVISASSLSGNGSAISAINASSISSGTIGAAYVSGSYTNVTGLGAITVGTWNANVVSAQYGGTGSANLTANSVVVGNGASTVKVVAPGTANNVLTSDGTTWISQAPTGGSTGAGTITRTDFTATGGQTVFSVTYSVGLIDVYRNGVKLATTDFTATNGTSFTLASGAVSGDVIQAEVFSSLNIYSTITNDNFSGNAVQTTFTMSVSPSSTASTLVAISGVVQDPTTYTVSTNTLTFSAAPPTGTNNISVRYLGVPGTTSVGSINFGTTGLTPNTSSTGAVTVAGTLVAANGGTGLTSPGTSGNVLTSNGTAWVSSAPSGGGGQFFGNAAVKTIAYNANSISENLTVTSGNNGYSAGPVTINTGYTVTLETNAVWVIV